MASYKEDPGYESVREQVKSNHRSMIGSALLGAGLVLGGALVLTRDASRLSNAIGAGSIIGAVIPTYYFIKNALQASRMDMDFREKYNTKQAIKEATKEIQQENALQQSPDAPKWQQEVAAQAAASQSAEKTR